MGYIHGAQGDLKIALKLTENLSSYTAVMHFRKDSVAVGSETTVTAAVTAVTSVLSYISYTLTVASSVVPAGDYNLIIDGELTHPTSGLTRRTSPAVVHVNRYGQIPYTET